MRFWTRVIRSIDGLNELFGRGVAWLCLLMVLIGAYNAVARYLGRFIGRNLSSNSYIELQWYLFSAVFLLGAAYALRHNVHVRVDVVYGKLSRRARAWVDLLGTIVLLLPFAGVTLWLSVPSVLESFRIREVSPDPGGLPRYPLKALLLVSFGLLMLQGLAQLARYVAILRGRALPGDIDTPTQERPHGEA